MKFENKFYDDKVYKELDYHGSRNEDQDLYTYDKVSRNIINEIKTYYEYNEPFILEQIKYLSCSKSVNCIDWRFLYLRIQYEISSNKSINFTRNVQTYFWKLKRFELFNPSQIEMKFHEKFKFEHFYKMVDLKIKYDQFFKRFFLFLHYYEKERDYENKNIETVLVASHYDYDIICEIKERIYEWIDSKNYIKYSYVNARIDSDEWHRGKKANEEWCAILDKSSKLDKTCHYCMTIDSYNIENNLFQDEDEYEDEDDDDFGDVYLSDDYSYKHLDERFFTSFSKDNDDNDDDKIIKSDKKGILLDDIAGLDDVKKAFLEKVILPVTHKKYYQQFDKKTGGGILLYGLPGTGKTMFAEAVSNEINAKFIALRCSDIKAKWYGETEQNIKKIFDEARKHKRAIIFFDEFDAIGGKRTSGDENNASNNIVPELLPQIQGINSNTNTILLIAATNRPWDIDTALLRPGRFDTKIYIPLPNLESRKKIFQTKLKMIPNDKLNFDYLAKITDGCNGADVAEFIEKLKMEAIHKSIAKNKTIPINNKDVQKVLKDFKPSVMVDDLKKLEEFRFN